MVYTNELKGLIRSKGFSQKAFAKRLGISLERFNRKINNKAVFKEEEIMQMIEILQVEDVRKYFFMNGGND